MIYKKLNYFFTVIKKPTLDMLIKIFLLINIISAQALAYTPEQERWLNAEDDNDVSHVNEGQLVFIPPPSDKKPLHSINQLTIDKNSIDNGWVKLQQCYKHLGILEQAEISYKYRFMKQLTLISKKNIDKASVKKQSIELSNIKKNAELCISADVRIFYQNPDLSFSLINGPFHRRFLDGYYPYHVTLKINYPEQLLLFKNSIPKQQKDFSIQRKTNQIIVDTYFEGILNTEMRFMLKNN